MAILIPDSPKDCTYSERVVYRRLGDDLDKNWIVLHSLGLVDHETKRRGEADIVILSSRGIFVLEVKGGRVSCRDGKWYFSVPGGEEVERKEDPWTQASGAMFAVTKRIRERASDLQGLLYGFGVVMPMEKFSTQSSEIDLEVLLDKRHFGKNLSFYIGQLERRWRQIYVERGFSTPRSPTIEDIRRVRKILRPDVESAFSLGSWLTGLEEKLLELTNEQIRVSRRLLANSRMIVTGKAGTGKTVLAVQRALQLGEKGMKVLFLCFNQLLARHISASIEGKAGAALVTIRHLHGHYHNIIAEAGLADQLTDDHADSSDFFGQEFPSLYCDALMGLDLPPYDAVVVDEAQDILTPQHLDALDLTVRGGLEGGCWHLFLDPQQNIYGQLSELAEKRFERISVARDDLLDNCRNTREVAYQTSILSTLDVAVENAPPGPSCECIYYDTPEQGVARLEAELMRLLAGDVAADDIIILSTRKLDNSIIAGRASLAGLTVRDVSYKTTKKSIAFSTMHSFKGLERSVVIAIDLGEIGDSARSMLYYAGLSRARTLLIPLIPKECKTRYSDLVVDFGRRIGRA
ncbi:nuclease-related domain-containing DEAD/DEAH box helicase [Pseudomonas gingeri]|uniref:nuclease-related domain-containing DEAD/DEAH box helicase n=1 Tax=Pseudomonas gingeri TaxID=117681 RepID=UPI00159F87AC|nr:NERD domain-containing protein/DEAD/DEAH box helicase [Pseudomonas gingeri]NWE26820.1 NERD domain-containing protein [Pseudomonas gingeri]NWE94840.1 NERD domain-containing protein [Pseudomonas gingeri]